jgi:hypothetical protein
VLTLAGQDRGAFVPCTNSRRTNAKKGIQHLKQGPHTYGIFITSTPGPTSQELNQDLALVPIDLESAPNIFHPTVIIRGVSVAGDTSQNSDISRKIT